MRTYEHTASICTASRGLCMEVQVACTPSSIVGKNAPPRKTNDPLSTPGTRTAKQIAADQKNEERRQAAEEKQKAKDEKRREKEVVQKETDNRFTSITLIAPLEDSFGVIDFDPCWHERSALHPKDYLDVRRGDNGLRDPWSGSVIFVNPPWSAADKWLRRAYHQWLEYPSPTVICLVPAKTETRFFHETLIKEADLYFMEGRPIFSKEDGTSEGTKVATMLVIFGAKDKQKLRLAELVKGAWWPARKRSAVRVKKTYSSIPKASSHCGLLSCAQADGSRWTAICNPSVVQGQSAGLA